jgi:Ran GTPase-activating protein (RanGAP) involved in mRNA processing and transport
MSAAWGAAAKSCNALLVRVEQNDVTLTELVILPSKSFGAVEVERLAAALGDNTNLTTISASGHAIPPAALGILGMALVKSKTLKRIAIGDKNMGDEGVAALFEDKGCGALEAIDLAYKNISEEGMKILGAFLGDSTTLIDLNLSRNPIISNQGVVAFCEAASGDTLTTSSSLRTINLSECQIGAQGMESLAKLLIQTTGCTTLGLSSNPLGPLSCSSLVSLLQEGNLQSLQLASCELGDAGVTSLCQTIKACTGLRILDLSDNGIGAEGANEFAKSLQGDCWKAMKELKLANNSIGSDGMTAIAEALSSLETLDATQTKCGVQGATSILRATGLKRLRLFNNELGSEGFKAIAAMLPECRLLELDLGGNRADADDLLLLLQTLRATERITLKVLEIGGNATSMEVEEEIKQIKKVHPDLDIARDRPRQEEDEQDTPSIIEA